MFTDEEKEYVLLAYYLGRKKLLNCIALQQLTKDILDVFHFESPIAVCRGKKINPTAGCCLCKEKETIFKDFLEYYLLKDNPTGYEEVHEKDVENVWADVSRLWKNLDKYDGHVSRRKLILNYEKSGEALMKTHNVKIYECIKKKYGDLENLGNWSRIIRKVQAALESLHRTLEKMCDSKAAVQSVHKVPKSGESVRVAPITLNVQENAPVLAKYAMQCRTYGIEAIAESPTSVRMKYMVCLKCSMENDYSQPISVMGLHSKYFTICQGMFLVFERKLHQNDHSIESKICTFSQSNTKRDESLPSSGMNQGSVLAKPTVTDLADLTEKAGPTAPGSNEAIPVEAVKNVVTQPTRMMPIGTQPSHEEHYHTLFKCTSKKTHKTCTAKQKHDQADFIEEWPIRYIDDRYKPETLTETISQLEKFAAKFNMIQKLKRVPGLQRSIPLPDMPIMRNFKVYHPAEGEPWPICHDFTDETSKSIVPPAASPPAIVKSSRCDLRISPLELFDDRECLLFPEVALDVCDNPYKDRDYASRDKILDNPNFISFCPIEGDSKRWRDVGVEVTQTARSPGLSSMVEMTDVQTDRLETDTNMCPSTEANSSVVKSWETKEDFDKAVMKNRDAVDKLRSITSNNCDDDVARFCESEQEMSNDSASQSEFSIYVAEYLAKFVPDLDETLKSFLARRQRLKGKTEPAKLHFSHYLCSVNGTMVTEALRTDFLCSKMVRIGAPAKARKLKDSEWVPKSLSRLTKLVLHEQILRQKQDVIERRSMAKNAQKKTRSSRSRRWKYCTGLRNSIKTVECATSLSRRPPMNGNVDSVQRNTVSGDTKQSSNDENIVSDTSDQTPALISQSHSTNNDINVDSESRKCPTRWASETVTQYEERSEEVAVSHSDHCKLRLEDPQLNEGGSLDHTGETGICLSEEISGVTSMTATSTDVASSESPDVLLRMRYKRDSHGNWKHVDFKKTVQWSNEHTPLSLRSSMPTNTPASEFHHKLSVISHHRPPKINKSSNRNQSVVQNFVNSFQKSKDKRRRSMYNSCRSLLFSSSYLPSFEEIGFTTINPSPTVFAATPRLQQISMSRRRKSILNITRLLTKQRDIVAQETVPTVSHDICQQPFDLENIAVVTNRVKNNPETPSENYLQSKFNSGVPGGNVWNEHQQIERRDRRCSSVISAKSAEYAVSALESCYDVDDTHCSSFDPHHHGNRLEYESFVSQVENSSVEPTPNVSTNDEPTPNVSTNCVITSKMLLKQDGEDDSCCGASGSIIPTTTLGCKEKTKECLKPLDKSAMFASSNFECGYMTMEYKYHLSYESVLDIMNSIAQKCEPGHLHHVVPGLPKHMGWNGGRLWKSCDRLSIALKYCFTSRNKTPMNKRRSNKQIGEAIRSYREFCDRVVACRLSKKELKSKNEHRNIRSRYWWNFPSCLPSEKEQSEQTSPPKSQAARTLYAGATSSSKCDHGINLECGQRLSGTSSHVFNNAKAKIRLRNFAKGFENSCSSARLKLLDKLDRESDANIPSDMNHCKHPCSDDKKYVDDACSSESMSYCKKRGQSDVLAKVSRRKRKCDTTDGPNCKQIRALVTIDERNMKRYAQTGTSEQNARCLQPLFESSLNIHSVSRVLYDSANAKSFSLVPPEFTQNTPAVFKLGSQSLPLLQADENAHVRLDSKDEDNGKCSTFSASEDANVGLDSNNRDRVKRWACCHGACISHERYSSATTKLTRAISLPRTRYRRFPCLLRFKAQPCTPKGLSRARQSHLSWDFDRRGRRPKNIGIRTPSRSVSCASLRPFGDSDETVIRLFGKIPVVIIPKCKL